MAIMALAAAHYIKPSGDVKYFGKYFQIQFST